MVCFLSGLLLILILLRMYFYNVVDALEVYGASIFSAEVSTVSVSAHIVFGPTDPRRKVGAGTWPTEFLDCL